MTGEVTGWMAKALNASTYTGLLRTQQLAFWERNPVIQQVPKGHNRTITVTTEVGLSQTDAYELGQSLGIEIGPKAGVKLSAQVSEKFGISTTKSEQEVFSTDIQLNLWDISLCRRKRRQAI
jgi:hypothetical protein